MPAAARIGDQSTHGGVIIPPASVPGVYVEGLPAAVQGDTHVCPITPSHPTSSPITAGSTSVFIGGRPAVRAIVDVCGCGAAVAAGAVNTMIGG